jgi:NAD(P)H-nitrite reductase large subunit
MQKINYLIIGGGIAGTTAAEFIRMNDDSGQITIISEEPETLYSRVLLPYYLKDQIPFERLSVRKLNQYKENKIELVKGVRTVKIDTQKREVTLSNNETVNYEKLLIASGGKVNRLEITGNNLAGIAYLRTIEDVKNIKKLTKGATKGVVIGGGFIGIDFAEIFIHTGLDTTCVIRGPYFWSEVVGERMAKFINQILEKNGVKINSRTTVSEFLGEDKLEQVKLSSGEQLSADIVGIGIGLHIGLDYLKGSGLKTNKGVATNEFLETNVRDVWAAGDVAEFYDPLFAKSHLLGNWSNAAAQGKVVGSNMVVGWGDKSREKFSTVSAYTTSIFDASFTFLGDPANDEKTEIIIRGSESDGKIGRLHIRDDVITGATLINLPADRKPIEELIKNRVKISASREKLADSSLSLSELTKD